MYVYFTSLKFINTKHALRTVKKYGHRDILSYRNIEFKWHYTNTTKKNHLFTVLHRDTIVYRRGHQKWPARPSKPTGGAIENDRRGHRNLPARPSKMTGAAIETVVYIVHRKWPARPSKPTGAAIETYRRGHRNLPARPSKMTGAAIETYRRGHRKWPARPSKPLCI